MCNWEEGPDCDIDKEKLSDQYYDWLTETCKCPDCELGDCECPGFEEWCESLKESAVEGMDEEDFEEQYG